MPTTLEFTIGHRTLVRENMEDVEAYITAWRLNNSPFQVFRTEDGEEKLVNLNLVTQILTGDQRTTWDCLRDRGEGDSLPLAGRPPNSATSSTPSETATE